jgi:MFS family permease
MRIFLIIWVGQFISLLGSKLTEFALAIWGYKHMGSVTQVAFLVLLLHLPNVMISPIAGALVDRWNRRWAMLLSDSASGLCTLMAMLLAFSGQLQLWHIYLGVAILSGVSAFQVPAYSAAIAQLVPKQHYGRANGMVELPVAVSRIMAPLLAGVLIEIVKLEGILLIDFSTFILAMLTLLAVRFPHFRPHQHSAANQLNPIHQLLQESAFSWRYITERPSLLRLWMFLIVTYFTIGMFDLAFWLLILRSGTGRFGLVVSVAGLGMLLGSTAMSVWGGPKRRTYGILSFVLVQGVVIILLGVGAPSSILIASIGAFVYLFADPMIMGCNRAIWQSKVPLELQGRIFALQQMLQRGAMVLAYLVTGVLIDRVLGPLLAAGFLRNHFNLGLGNGPESSICLFLILLGMAKILTAAVGYRMPLLLQVDTKLGDAEDAAIALTKARP